jgi:hypothetical protein
VDVQKLEHIKQLKEQRKALDDEIKALTVELTRDFSAELNGDRKPRKRKGEGNV